MLNHFFILVALGTHPQSLSSQNLMFLRCHPAHVRYSLFNLPEHKSQGITQQKNLKFDDFNVILTGEEQSFKTDLSRLLLSLHATFLSIDEPKCTK